MLNKTELSALCDAALEDKSAETMLRDVCLDAAEELFVLGRRGSAAELIDACRKLGTLNSDG